MDFTPKMILLQLRAMDGARDEDSVVRCAEGASVQHTLNLQFRPEGLGVVCAERSESTNHDNRNCQVEAVVRQFIQINYLEKKP